MKPLVEELGALYASAQCQLSQLSKAQIEAIRQVITQNYQNVLSHCKVVFESNNPDLEDFEKVKRRFWSEGVLAISSDFNDSELLGETVNLQFRAWHDYLHITNNYPFGFVGEFSTFLKHIEGNEEVAGLVEVLFSEVVLQTAYFEVYGSFAEHQKVVLPHISYVNRCIERFQTEQLKPKGLLTGSLGNRWH